MKREEKNQMTKRKIIDSALREFSKNGYRGASVNDICLNGGVSKGIVYHYFDTKEELYLLCVEECFSLLTDYIGEDLIEWKGEVEEGLDEYFKRREKFFYLNPIYINIFTEAMIFPSSNLKEGIKRKTRIFDVLNKKILRGIIGNAKLGKDIGEDDVIEIFLDYQGYINSNSEKRNNESFIEHERRVKKAISILLYGVFER